LRGKDHSHTRETERLRFSIREKTKKLSLLQQNDKRNEKYAKKYIDKINAQNTGIKKLKELLKHTVEAYNIATKRNINLQSKVVTYLKREELKPEDVQEIIKSNTLDLQIITELDTLIESKLDNYEQLDFYDPEMDSASEIIEIEEKQEATIFELYRKSKEDYPMEMTRPYIENKAHSADLDNYGRSSNKNSKCILTLITRL